MCGTKKIVSIFSFSQLYFNLFVNLTEARREGRIRLRIDKDFFCGVFL